MGIVTGSTNWNGQDNFFDFVQFAAEKVGMTREEYMAIHGIGNAIKENSNIKTFAAFNESKTSDEAAKAIDKAITKIDSSVSTVDFAMAVGKILREEYGKHNFDSFMEVLHKDLGI